jgi:hypothetical protein
MTTDDIKDMAMKLAVLIDSFETRGDAIVRQNTLAAAAMAEAAQDASRVAGEVSTQAVEALRQTASTTLERGLREPLSQTERQLQTSMAGLREATAELEKQVRTAGTLQKATAWKVFAACAIASLGVLGVAAYAAMHARTEVARAEWTRGINAAVASGNLAPCADGGICARVDGKRWVRLDQAGN